MSQWFIDGYFWRHPSSGDAGDLIFNTMSRIMDMNDKSLWAHSALDNCIVLLEQPNPKRWPDRLTQENTAPNRLVWWFNDWYSRPQDDMTRDPYVAVICCAMFLGRASEIRSIKIPWYCYSRETWRWRKTLIKDNQKQFVRRLDYYRAMAVVIKNSDDPNIIANKLEAGI